MQRFELLHLLLEDPNVVHEGHHPVRGHRGGVKARRRQEGSHMQGHGALRGVEHEQLAPRQPQQSHLVGDLQVGEEGNIPGPLHGAEEHPGGEFANVLDAHDVVGLHALAAIAGRRVGLRSQQKRDISG